MKRLASRRPWGQQGNPPTHSMCKNAGVNNNNNSNNNNNNNNSNIVDVYVFWLDLASELSQWKNAVRGGAQVDTFSCSINHGRKRFAEASLTNHTEGVFLVCTHWSNTCMRTLSLSVFFSKGLWKRIVSVVRWIIPLITFLLECTVNIAQLDWICVNP